MEKTKEVGIIGQMYEERKVNKSGERKVGVLESRDDKFKTLMMRDAEGKSFNIQFSTFKSNWRKYQGEEVIQTSTQVEEQREAQVEAVEQAKEQIKKKSETVNISTEEKVKKLRSLEQCISGMITEKQSNLRVSRKSKGGIVVSHKKFALIEVWYRFKLDKIDVLLKEDIVAPNRECFNKIINESEYSYMENWIVKHRCVTTPENFSEVFSDALELAIQYESSHLNDAIDKRKKKNQGENEKTEEE